MARPLAHGHSMIKGNADHRMTTSALAQAFYLSEEFRALRIETRDYREHPVLGGISGTRWNAYDAFVASHGRLAASLEGVPAFKQVLELRLNPSSIEEPDPPAEANIRRARARNARLSQAGMLAGDARANRLVGSVKADVLIGGDAADVIIGRGGGDRLWGGADADRFVFGPHVVSADPQVDEICDFDGAKGDRIQLAGARSYQDSGSFSGRAGEVIVTNRWMARVAWDPDHPPEAWMIQGMQLALDRDGDREADRLISLPGLIDLQPDWLLIN